MFAEIETPALLLDASKVERNCAHARAHPSKGDAGPIDFARYPIGTWLRILPNHACATASQHSEYRVIRDGRIAETWERFGGW